MGKNQHSLYNVPVMGFNGNFRDEVLVLCVI